MQTKKHRYLLLCKIRGFPLRFQFICFLLQIVLWLQTIGLLQSAKTVSYTHLLIIIKGPMFKDYIFCG